MGGGDASVNPHERKLGKQEHPTNQLRHRTLVLKYCNCNYYLITQTALSAGLRESNGQQQWSAKVSQVQLRWEANLYMGHVTCRPEDSVIWDKLVDPLSLDVQLLGRAGLKMVRLLGTLNQHVLKSLSLSNDRLRDQVSLCPQDATDWLHSDSSHWIKIIFLFQLDCLTLNVFVHSTRIFRGGWLTIITVNYRSVINEI